jgi:hypothetical protein
MCSATWQFTGACSGRDMWNEWKVSGRASPPDAFVRRWLDVPIFVVGYELLKFHPQSLRHPLTLLQNFRHSWFMIGSAVEPDSPLSLGPRQTHTERMFPTGLVQPWPPSTDARPIVPLLNQDGTARAIEGDLLDLHGACFGDGKISLLLTVYYTPANKPSGTLPEEAQGSPLSFAGSSAPIISMAVRLCEVKLPAIGGRM